jgi:hypothetical protein
MVLYSHRIVRSVNERSDVNWVLSDCWVTVLIIQRTLRGVSWTLW